MTAPDPTPPQLIALIIALVVSVFGILLLGLAGCEPRPAVVVGFDPATDRCRAWENDRFVGPFLPNERCMGQPETVELSD